MLIRQNILLEMLSLADRPVSKLELVKWAFVFQRETSSGSEPSFYDFVPYHYGPYSFGMAREIEGLTATGYIRESDKAWELGVLSDNRPGLAKSGCDDVRRVVHRFLRKSVNDVIHYVYHTYPQFTINSKREQLAARPIALPAVFTAGYEGLQIDGFLNMLVQNGITRVIDVRNNPVARRFGFHKSTLKRLCGHLEIAYEHVPELGIVSEQRQTLDCLNDYEVLFRRYETTTLVTEKSAIERVAEMIAQKPSVLVCMEADHRCCHRARLANAIGQKTGLPITHLEAEP